MQHAYIYSQSPVSVNRQLTPRFTGNVHIGTHRIRVYGSLEVLMVWLGLAIRSKKRAAS